PSSTDSCTCPRPCAISWTPWRRPHEVETRYVSNLLGRGLGELSEEPRNLRTLVQIGWNREIKDVLFSLEMLERLRRHDERFRLQLVGPGLPAASDENAYQRRVRARLASFVPQA